MNFDGIFFANSHALFLLPLILFLCILAVWRYREQIRFACLLTVPEYRSQLLLNFSLTKKFLKTLLTIAALLFLFLGLLRIQWGKKDQKLLSQGRDLVIALDISRSMLAHDCTPDRLQFAKQKIADLVRALNADRVALIIFSDSALIQCPLTVDRTAFFLFLNALDCTTISGGSTALDQPIRKALDMYARLPEHKSKLLLLITDGEDFGQNIAGIDTLIREQGIALWCLGIGTTQGSPLPLYDDQGNQTGHIKDTHGNVVISRLNEVLLSKLVTDCGGYYLRATSDRSDITHIMNWINTFEKQGNQEVQLSRYEERFYFFTGLSFLCLLLEWLL